MRMRRKKNLDTFLTLYPDLLTIPAREELDVSKALETPAYFDLSAWFGEKPVELEIGCGKGQFICELAKKHPEKGFLAVEVSQNVIVEACRKVREAGLTNVHFVNVMAELLPRHLPKDSIEQIYLNFSPPFPKATYALHRLTHPRFLESYRAYLIPGREIHLKTDNRGFFEYSIEQLSACGFRLKNVSLDLHHSDFEGNIVTEYEQRFSAEGLPIYRLEAVAPEKP